MRTSLLIISLPALLFFSGCSKGNNNPIDNVDVYVSGGYKTNAVYWKNNNMVTLGQADYIPGRIAVNGGDVYVPASRMESDLSPHAIYWKNGVLTDLGQGEAGDITVNGNDVYVAGILFKNNTFDIACWKNGVITDYGEGNVAQLISSNGDVYMAGSTYSTDSASHAVYWKNGVPVDLGSGYLTSIAVSGSDVYVAGITYINRNQVVGYWKNGMFTQLGNGYAFITSIAVNGTTVYCTGYDENNGRKGVYWKNTTPVYFSSIAELICGATLNNNIYFTGDNYQYNIGVGEQQTGVTAFLIENSSIFTLASSIQASLPTTYQTFGNGIVVKNK